MPIIQQIILGTIQGIAEWLPISSEGAIILTLVNVYKVQVGLDELIRYALFLHLGTLFAAITYFWKDIISLIKALFPIRKTIDTQYQILTSSHPIPQNTKKSFDVAQDKLLIIHFLLITTIISGILGFALYKLAGESSQLLQFSGKTTTFCVGLLLLITGYMQLRAKKSKGTRSENEITRKDSFILGLVQSFTVLPGLSRSGMTISFLLFRKFDDQTALKLSFLMSIPIVILGNIVLNFGSINQLVSFIPAVFTSFIVGLASIHVLMLVAKKVNFGWFAVGFGIITLISVVI